jgi:hypothetical protein
MDCNFATKVPSLPVKRHPKCSHSQFSDEFLRLSVFAELRAALNKVWGVKAAPKRGFKVNKYVEPKIKGDKYAKNKKEYRILPWALGRWLVFQ